jgi:hypothetical protein
MASRSLPPVRQPLIYACIAPSGGDKAKASVSDPPAALLSVNFRAVPFFRGSREAIRLLKALVAAGADSNTLMAGAWVQGIALKISLRGTDLASALAYAEGQGWIADGQQKGWIAITRSGERAARFYVVGL